MNTTLLLLAAASAGGIAGAPVGSRGPISLRDPARSSRASRRADRLVVFRRTGQGTATSTVRQTRPSCPRCASTEAIRWGRFGLRQRYRCRECGKTFSDFTGTALAGLRRADLWLEFCRCILDGRTVRDAAARIGVHRDTAFRWRHRLLRELRSSESYPLGPRVGVGETFVYGGREWLLIALDEKGRIGGRRIEAGGRGRRCAPADIAALLDGRLERGALLLSTDGKFGPSARFARDHQLRWRQRHAVDRELDAFCEPVPTYGFRFRRWLRRFRGVAGHYLDNYLGWFRLQDGSIWSGVCRMP